MKKKLTYTYIKSKFEEAGYSLLSKEYINNHTPLVCECPNKHQYNVTWSAFQQDYRCRICYELENFISYTEVRNLFEKECCVLLSKEYINNRTKLDYICKNGHKHSITLDSFKQGHRCNICAGSSSPTINFIKTVFEKEGYNLRSFTYKNAHSKLDYICSNGHRNSMNWHSFRQGHRCPTCAGLSKPTIAFVRSKFEEVGYTLLTKEYKNSRTKLDYICSNNHEGSIRWGNFYNQKDRCPICSLETVTGYNSVKWKGGVSKLKLPLYETYAPQLEKYYDVVMVEQVGLELLGVNCMYCDQTFVPKKLNIDHRLRAIKGKVSGEHNLYCSENCKLACPTYRQVSYPKGFKTATSREVQPALRKLVLKRDNYKCQICDAGLEEVELHCHHIEAVSHNPIESADIDNCITLCKKHHKQVHKLPNCDYHELKCKN